MVVNIGQMSSKLPTTSGDFSKTETSTESFESVLVNTSKTGKSEELNDTLKEQENVSRSDVDTEESVEEKAESITFVNVAPLQDMSFTQGVNFDINSVMPVEFLEAVVLVSEDASLTFDAKNNHETQNSTLANQIQPLLMDDRNVDVADEQQDSASVIDSLKPISPEVMQVEGLERQTKQPDVEMQTFTVTDSSSSSENSNVRVDEDFVQVQAVRNDQDGVETYEMNLNQEVEYKADTGSFYATIGVQSLQSVTEVSKPQEIQYVPTVNNQVLEQITRNLENVSMFRNEFSFTLNPENLGEVKVRMSVENGVLTVELSSSSKETQSILAANLESIKEVLRNISIENQINEVSQDNRQDYLEQQNRQNRQNQHGHQETGNSGKRINEAEFTENFLSMINMFGTEDI